MTLCLLVATCCIALAQTKVVERSAKKAPEWINTANPSALVVTVTANTIADAQVKAMAEVTERIILSVASNVSVSQRNESSEIVEDDNVQLNISHRLILFRGFSASPELFHAR